VLSQLSRRVTVKGQGQVRHHNDDWDSRDLIRNQ